MKIEKMNIYKNTKIGMEIKIKIRIFLKKEDKQEYKNKQTKSINKHKPHNSSNENRKDEYI